MDQDDGTLHHTAALSAIYGTGVYIVECILLSKFEHILFLRTSVERLPIICINNS